MLFSKLSSCCVASCLKFNLCKCGCYTDLLTRLDIHSNLVQAVMTFGWLVFQPSSSQLLKCILRSDFVDVKMSFQQL